MKLTLTNLRPSTSYSLTIGLLFTVFSFLTSCVNYMGIHSNKKIAPPTQFSLIHSVPHQNGEWPTTDWAKQFGDPQLVALIDEALASNPDLQAAQARITQARALEQSRASAFFPTVNLRSDIARVRLSETFFPPSFGGGRWFTVGDFLAKINYDIDIWGKNLASFRQAQFQAKASEAAYQQARLSIATSVAATYNQLTYFYALRQILKRTVNQRVALEKISAIRLHNGLDTEVQINQSRNVTANARTQLVDTEGQIILTRQQLGTLLGAGPDRGLSIRPPRLKTINTPKIPADLPLNLIGRRPDIVRARWVVEASCQGIKNIKARFYPDVNIVALGGFLSLGLDRLFTTASQQYQFGPAFSLPIFDGNNLRSQLKGQYGVYEEAVANYNAALNNAMSDVASQITAINSIDQQLKTQKVALYTADRAFNLARYQYRTEIASQLVVLDAETLYLNAQTTRIQLATNRRALQIALIKALGGGFGSCHPCRKVSEDK